MMQIKLGSSSSYTYEKNRNFNTKTRITNIVPKMLYICVKEELER